MDIVKVLKIPHLKANFATLTLKHKFFLIVFLLSFTTILLPHETFAQTPADLGPVLIFDMSSTDYQDYLDQLSQDLTDKYYQEQALKQAIRQQKLTEKVQNYLRSEGSPLASFASTLVSLRNWKKIVALSNAESSMCEHYPEAKANCWGVGGASLWDLGTNLGDGVIAMNHFLNKFPKHSAVKYSSMSFEKMNGLYKQPPADHWVYNNQVVYDKLLAIEKSIQ